MIAFLGKWFAFRYIRWWECKKVPKYMYLPAPFLHKRRDIASLNLLAAHGHPVLPSNKHRHAMLVIRRSTEVVELIFSL